MKTKIETISPQRAQRLLDDHWIPEKQRKPSPRVVSAYARTMKANQWLLTHQGIAINDRGELLDGLHRLLAIVESGITIDIPISRDVPDHGSVDGLYTMDAIDRGRERAVGQQLALRHDLSKANTVAAICRGIMWLCTYSRNLPVGKFSVANALHVLDIYGDEVGYVLDNRSKDCRVRNSPVCAAGAFAIKVFPAQVKEFYKLLATGENLTARHPALGCRRWLLDTKEKGSHFRDYRAVLMCAMKHVKNEKLSTLRDSDIGFNFFLEKQQRAVNKLLAACGYAD